MRHLAQWGLALSMILVAPKVFALDDNTYICETNGRGSARVVVHIDPAVLNTLVADLKNKKKTNPPVSSVADIPYWMQGFMHPGTRQDGHTGCVHNTNLKSEDWQCTSTTYQCALNNTGKYHGIIELRREDVKHYRTPDEWIHDKFSKTNDFGDEIRHAIEAVVKDPSRIQDGSLPVADAWTTPSACLARFQDARYNPSKATITAKYKDEIDEHEAECGQHDGRESQYKTEDDAVKADPKYVHAVDPDEGGTQDETLAQLQGTLPGDCGDFADGKSQPADAADACRLVNRCGGQIAFRTCRPGCSLSDCVNDYEKFLSAAGRLTSSKATFSTADSGGIPRPSFNMSEVTHRAVSILDKYEAAQGKREMDCALYRAARDKDPGDDVSLKAIDGGCKGDMSLSFLREVLRAFQDPNYPHNFAGKAEQNEFSAMKTFLNTYAQTLPNDADLKKLIRELTKSQGFLDFLSPRESDGGAKYFGKTSVIKADPVTIADKGRAGSSNPDVVFSYLKSKEIQTSCILRVRFAQDSDYQKWENFYLASIERDYRNADKWASWAGDHCAGSSSRGHSRTSGR